MNTKKAALIKSSVQNVALYEADMDITEGWKSLNRRFLRVVSEENADDFTDRNSKKLLGFREDEYADVNVKVECD